MDEARAALFLPGVRGLSPGRRSMRRLAEKPANLRFFLRSMISKG
jgi:hypothetical protein